MKRIKIQQCPAGAMRALAAFNLAILSTVGLAGAVELPRYTGTPVEANLKYHDGALRPAVGTWNIQVMRANRTHPEAAGGFSATYNHAPMLAYWQGQFYLEYLNGPVAEHQAPGETLLVTSPDGITWSQPKLIFPAIDVGPGGKKSLCHQRMGFYTASNGRFLALVFYGKEPTPNDGNGLGRAVREILKDGTFGPIYFIRYNPGYSEANTPCKLYTASSDAGFKAACEELLANKLFRQQWWEEDQKCTDDFYVVNGGKAFCWYTLPDKRIVGLWKGRSFVVAPVWEKGQVPKPQVSPSILYHGAKGWGQRLSDSSYALVYNPVGKSDEFRYPLAVTTGKDGLVFDQDLLTVHGEINTPRFQGRYKDSGPQYVRGIEEGNGTPPDGGLWLAYSVNKEDMWVSRVAVPVQGRLIKHAADDWTKIPTGTIVPNWNVYSCLWAPVSLLADKSGKFLRLRDKDPYDYAKAVRVFPESKQVKLGFQVRAAQAGQNGLEIEVLDASGRRPVRLTTDPANQQLYANNGAETKPVAKLLANTFVPMELTINTVAKTYNLKVNGKVVVAQAGLAEPVETVERIEFRTGHYRLTDMSRIYEYKTQKLLGDLPGADVPIAEAIYDLRKFSSSAIK